jgi:hypothetical protein
MVPLPVIVPPKIGEVVATLTTVPPPDPPLTACHALPDHRHVASEVPVPAHVPTALASVKMYTDPVTGEEGGEAKVALVACQGSALSPVSTYAVVASFVLASAWLCVVAVVPFGSAGVPERLAAVPLVL